MLARSAARRREISIRTALGASRWRLVQQLLTESLVLAIAGGALGLLLAVWGVDALLALGPETLPSSGGSVLDRTVLGFTLAVSVFTSLVFGLVPAAHAATRDAEASLRESGRSSGGVGRQRLRRMLVGGEIAIALLLLIGTGLMIQSFRRLLEVNPGFATEGVVSAQLSLPRANSDSIKITAFYADLVERARALPGATGAAAVSYLPLGQDGASYRFLADGQPFVEPQLRPSADFNVVTPGYFGLLQRAAVRGQRLQRAGPLRRSGRRRGEPDAGPPLLAQRERAGEADHLRRAGRERLAHGRGRRGRRAPAVADDRGAAPGLRAARAGGTGRDGAPGRHPDRSADDGRGDPRGGARDRPIGAGLRGANPVRGPGRFDLDRPLPRGGAGQLRGDRAGARGDRGLWRHLLRRHPALAGDRDPHGARRPAPGDPAARGRGREC